MFDTGTFLLALALGLGTFVLLVPLTVFVLECQLAVWPRRQRMILASSPHGEPTALLPPPRPTLGHAVTVVLIPAHNEEAGLASTLDSVLPTLGPRDAVLVVADNCTDQTAAVARSRGARVVERQDLTRRGKGFALACGVEALRRDPPEVVVFLDADCRVNELTVQLLAAEAHRSGAPAQALNLCDNRADGATLRGLSALGFHFKNLVRPAGLTRLGGPCHLMGTGMALPWKLVEQVEWGTSALAEDMQLGVDLALRGHPARFCPEVGVWSSLPDGTRAFVQQRTRWEQGHLRTLCTQLPRLAVGALRQRRWDLLLLALDLSVPPFSLLVFVWCLGLVASAVAWWWLGVPSVFAGVLAGIGLLMGLSILAGWAVYCRNTIPWTTLLMAPWYMLRKLPIYLQFFLARGERNWVRTERGPSLPTSR